MEQTKVEVDASQKRFLLERFFEAAKGYEPEVVAVAPGEGLLLRGVTRGIKVEEALSVFLLNCFTTYQEAKEQLVDFFEASEEAKEYEVHGFHALPRYPSLDENLNLVDEVHVVITLVLKKKQNDNKAPNS